MAMRRGLFMLGLMASAALVSAPAQAQEAWAVKPAWVSAHENFLASPALRGRGSATPDETVAATYVASVFERYGLVHAPGMDTYLQTAPVIRTSPSGQSVLSVGDMRLAQGEGIKLLSTSNRAVSGPLTLGGDTVEAMVGGEVLLLAPPEGNAAGVWLNAARAKGAKLVILRETEFLTGMATRRPPRATHVLKGHERPGFDAVVVSAADYDRLKTQAGATVSLDPGAVERVETVTTNAIGYLPGSDPAAGYILIAAHLDHVGVQNGVIFPGANDNASGTTAVMEIAHALAAGEKPKRGVIFAGFGAEELGGLGSTWFVENPPVPLEDIKANLAIEMIAGGQDPNLPPGVMMMTGYERSNLGSELKARGALIAPDPYPDQNFFARSDNYAFALKGIVAHTISAFPMPDTYHQATDDLSRVDLPFMTQAIQSLIEPVRALTDGDFVPSWNEGGRPQPR